VEAHRARKTSAGSTLPALVLETTQQAPVRSEVMTPPFASDQPLLGGGRGAPPYLDTEERTGPTEGKPGESFERDRPQKPISIPPAEDPAWDEQVSKKPPWDKQVSKKWKMTLVRQLTLALYWEVMEAALRRGTWLNGEEISAKDELKMRGSRQKGGWLEAMGDCGKIGFIEVCRAGHTAKCVTRCCGKPPCPRYQRRRSNEWLARAERLHAEHPNKGGHRWRLITLNLKSLGRGMAWDIQKTLDVRKKFMRWLKKNYAKDGIFAGFGSVELGEKVFSENVHLHMITYCNGPGGGLPRDKIVSWLRSQDCTVSGCPHPVDDRCASCRSTMESGCEGPGCGVRHPGYDRTQPGSAATNGPQRERCNGSWIVNIQAIKDRESIRKDGKGGKKSYTSGLREALKYATKPTACRPNEDGTSTPAERAYIERALRFYLAMAGRHRVETYGLARKRYKEDEGAGDDAAKSGCCSECGDELVAFRGWSWSPITKKMKCEGVAWAQHEVLFPRDHYWEKNGLPP